MILKSPGMLYKNCPLSRKGIKVNKRKRSPHERGKFKEELIMNKNSTFEEIVRKHTNNSKEETTMSKKHNHSIYAAIRTINSPSFKDEMKEYLWRNPDAMFTWHKLWWDDDTMMVIEFYRQMDITERELKKNIREFCNLGDSKDRCRTLEAAFNRGDFIIKKGHIDGRMVIVVQILVD